eukprot:7000062-Ditylum_brightwellii.AAC.1
MKLGCLQLLDFCLVGIRIYPKFPDIGAAPSLRFHPGGHRSWPKSTLSCEAQLLRELGLRLQ